MNIVKLKKYLKREHANKARLAVFLGYASTDAIDKWLMRSSIPKWRHDAVELFIDSDVSTSTKTRKVKS